MTPTVAALYIDPGGPYPAIAGVDCWDLGRDAKTYAGPHPIVAHPPCGPWGRLRHLCTKQDPSCAIHAVEMLRLWGGVLEHPAHSKLWDHLGLPRPGELSFDADLRAVELCQVEWGHVARKRTWLLMTRSCGRLGAPPMPGRQPTHWVSGNSGEMTAAGMKRTSGPLARRTPQLFATELVRIARSARRYT